MNEIPQWKIEMREAINYIIIKYKIPYNELLDFLWKTSGCIAEENNITVDGFKDCLVQLGNIYEGEVKKPVQ